MSAIVIVLPSLRVRQGAGDQGQVWVLPLWAALSPPLAPFPALSPSAVPAPVPPQLCGTSEQALVYGNGKRLVGVGRAEEWRLGAHCQGGPECGGMWTGHLTLSRFLSSPSGCPRQLYQQTSSLLGGSWWGWVVCLWKGVKG